MSSWIALLTMKEYNGRLKRYPDNSWELLVCNATIFSEQAFDKPPRKSKGKPEKRQRLPIPEERARVNLERSQRRARGRIRDIGFCNDLPWFVTLTLDQRRADRYDIDALVKKMRTWLDNRVRRKGLVYVLVPELHKDGAIHLHGLMNDALVMVDSGVQRCREEDGKKVWYSVYNVQDWGLGFSEAVRVYGDRGRSIGYITKYINKAVDGASGGPIGGRWYYSGGDLKGPDTSYCIVPWDMCDNADYSFTVKEAGLEFRLYRGFDGVPDSVAAAADGSA